MASLVNMRFVCEQVSFPVCSVLFDNKVHAKYPARAISVGAVNIYSPYSVMFLVLAIWLSFILVQRTSRMYSFPARREMLLFLHVYIFALFLDLLLCCGVVRYSWKYLYVSVVSMQLACVVSSFVAMMSTGLVWIFPNRMSSVCTAFSRLMTFSSLSMAFFAMVISIPLSLGVCVFTLLYAMPLFFFSLFCFTQLAKLKQLNAEVWAYGAIVVSVLLFVLLGMTSYFLGMVIVLISDRYLDGVFLAHLISFFGVLQIYNLWSIDNEKEIECVNTVKT